MQVRKEIGVGVAAGVIVLVIGLLLEPIKERLPTWLQIAVGFAWAPIAVPRVVTWVSALALGYLAFDSWINTFKAGAERRLAKQSAGQKVVEKNQSAEQPANFSNEELAVIHVILEEDLPVDMQDLRDRLAFTPLRLRHALDTLIARGMIGLDNGDYHLTAQGRGIVVEQNLDTK